MSNHASNRYAGAFSVESLLVSLFSEKGMDLPSYIKKYDSIEHDLGFRLSKGKIDLASLSEDFFHEYVHFLHFLTNPFLILQFMINVNKLSRELVSPKYKNPLPIFPGLDFEIFDFHDFYVDMERGKDLESVFQYPHVPHDTELEKWLFETINSVFFEDDIKYNDVPLLGEDIIHEGGLDEAEPRTSMVFYSLHELTKKHKIFPQYGAILGRSPIIPKIDFSLPQSEVIENLLSKLVPEKMEDTFDLIPFSGFTLLESAAFIATRLFTGKPLPALDEYTEKVSGNNNWSARAALYPQIGRNY